MNRGRFSREVQAVSATSIENLFRYLPEAVAPYPFKDTLDQSFSFSSDSNMVEESQTPSPTEGPPLNFGEVVPGKIYRSAFPQEENFDSLRQLELTAILTLVAEKDNTHLSNFARAHGIKHFQILVPPNKEASAAISGPVIEQALSVVCDARHYPLLIHCNKGKHRTGCVVGCYRKITMQPVEQIIDEYRKYAGEKARELDVKYITEFDHHAMFVRLNEQVYQQVRDNGVVVTPPASDKNGEGPDLQALNEAAMKLSRLEIKDDATLEEPELKNIATKDIHE